MARHWTERCYECKTPLTRAVRWTVRPIPRLGGAERQVCEACAELIEAQASLEDEVRALNQVDRAVEHAHQVAAHPPVFLPPADVADVAEQQGHPLAQPTVKDAAT